MNHLVAYYQSIPAGAFSDFLDAVPDLTVFADLKSIRIPEFASTLGWTWAGVQTDIADNVVLRSPSIDARGGYNLVPINTAVDIPTYNAQNLRFAGQLPLDVNEGTKVEFQFTATGTRNAYAFLSLHDGDIAPISGEIISVISFATITPITGQWASGQLVFERELPVGDYNIVGMQAFGPGLVAARLAIPGSTMRPGIVATPVPTAPENTFARFGGYGSWGQFNTNTGISVEALGVGVTVAACQFDLIKV